MRTRRSSRPPASSGRTAPCGSASTRRASRPMSAASRWTAARCTRSCRCWACRWSPCCGARPGIGPGPGSPGRPPEFAGGPAGAGGQGPGHLLGGRSAGLPGRGPPRRGAVHRAGNGADAGRPAGQGSAPDRRGLSPLGGASCDADARVPLLGGAGGGDPLERNSGGRHV